MEFAYRLEALVKIFEQDDLPLSRVAAFFHQGSVREQTQAEANLQYLSECGGNTATKLFSFMTHVKLIRSEAGEDPSAAIWNTLLSADAWRLRHKPGTEQVCSLLPALELTLGQWKEEMAIMVELCRLAREHDDSHTSSVVKSHFLGPLLLKIKLLDDLLTNTRRVGYTIDGTGGFGEYLIDQLYKELSSA